jgi:diguanylate cyclase (GGDEF)-like protein
MTPSQSMIAQKSAFSQKVQETLRDALYTEVASLVSGAMLTVAAAGMSWLLTGDSAPLVIGIAAMAIACVRVLIVSLRKTQWLRWYSVAFFALSIAYLLCIDALMFWSVQAVNEASIMTIVTFVVAINTISIALRSFASKKLVLVQTLVIAVPCAVAFLSKGGVFYVAALIQVTYAYYVPRYAARLRNLFLSEMTYRSQSEELAARFRFAIDNMSHGMAMIDSDLKIVVSNAEMGECFGVPSARPLVGARFDGLVRFGRRRGILSPSDAERVMAIFSATSAPDSVARLEIPGPNERVTDLTLKRHFEGGWVLVAQDVTDQRRARTALDRAARFDSMTGLPNRAAFEARLVESLHVARGSGMRTEILFLDLDLFKQVNDTLGHKIGDRVIAESANRLSQSVGPDAFAARWGGDEFVVLRRGRDDADAVACAERLIAELSRPMWIEGAEIRVGASAGVAACIDGRTSMETLLQHADLALYTAKREARGAVRLFEPAMNDKARERRLLELDVQAALAARSFNLRYQPIVDLETTELVSFEALAEWRHPTRGSVSPVVFVTVLEELNLMQVFGSWALQRACEDAVRWPQPARVGVNVSAKQIDTLVEAVKRALAASGLPPERLELEITETAALEGGDEARRALETVRAMGVRVALDDFGTGFSSLSHLMSLPLDKVKIDKSFTQQLGQSRKADVLVANIARLTSQLGMRVTFEGIETQEQLALTRAVGVTAEGQGWLFGRATANADLGQYFAPAKGKKAVA